jgi:hypothetical protein
MPSKIRYVLRYVFSSVSQASDWRAQQRGIALERLAEGILLKAWGFLQRRCAWCMVQHAVKILLLDKNPKQDDPR